MENYDLLCSPMHHRVYFLEHEPCAPEHHQGCCSRPASVSTCTSWGSLTEWTLLTCVSPGLWQQARTCAYLYIISLEHEPCSPEHLQGCGSRPAQDRWRMPGPVGAGGRTPSRPLHLDPCTESVWPAAVPLAAACAGSGSPGITHTKL